MSDRTVLVTLLAVSGLLGPPHLRASEVPAITFAYSPFLDDACADIAKKPLDPQAVEELRRLVPRLETAWRQEGPAWLKAAREVVGQPFGFAEAKAALITCGISSLSHPLVIDMGPHLRRGVPDSLPADRRFVAAVFHEVLHRYVSDILTARGKDSTPLLRKYANEPPVVRNHLHLFAIREAAYARRGKSSDLPEVESFESRSPRAKLFTRAREIVQAEGFDRFLKDLRPPPKGEQMERLGKE